VSYILDALKKADRDRREARVPSLGTIHDLPEERRRTWPWVAGAIVALNVLAVAGFVVVRDVPPAVQPPPAVPVARPAPPPVETPAPAPPPVAVKKTPPVAPVAAPAAPAPARTAVARDDAAARQPDELKLEVLIYSPNPAERVAYINGQRYLEGQRVNARFVVEQITSDSVVLSSKDTRQVLRQQ
jgi:hypothetical protein